MCKKQSVISVFLRFWEKAACKMLMKLTPGLNFINILRTVFTNLLVQSANAESTLFYTSSHYSTPFSFTNKTKPMHLYWKPQQPEVKLSFYAICQGWPDFFDRGPNLKTIFHHGPHYWK